MQYPLFARAARIFACGALLYSSAPSQVPDGYVVFGSFQSSSGTNGIYFAHPRDTAATAIEVTGLPANLSVIGNGTRGCASLLRRPSDGALIAGERAATDQGVDLHVLRLSGNHVVFAQLFSCGTSGGAGEIPQCGLLPDERVVVAATGLTPGGALSVFTNGSYGWQGLAILDTVSGSLLPIPVTNWNQFVGVINGLAVSSDGTTVYVASYISATAGALWSVPTAGGTATQVATLSSGASNVTVDLDGTVLVTALNGPPNLFRYRPATGVLEIVATTTGPLNAVAIEAVTGNYFLATANSGGPPRSLIWRTPTGPDNLLLDPSAGIISGMDSNPNPESYGVGTAGVSSYWWRSEASQDALPLAGNAQFSLTVDADQGALASGMIAVSFAATPPTSVLGLQVLIEPTGAVPVGVTLVDTATVPLPLPTTAAVVGLELFAQAFFVELPGGALVASPGLAITIL